MNRAISTLLSGIVLSTLIATSALATAQKPSMPTMTGSDTQTIDFDRIYVEKFGS